MGLYGPIALIVVANIFYNICSKSIPEEIHPLAALTATYCVGAVVAGTLYFVLSDHADLLREYHFLNWRSIVLGFAVVGLEAGSIYMYKAGWAISTGQMFYGVILAIALIFVGMMLYHETITGYKIAGILVCLAGLFLINK